MTSHLASLIPREVLKLVHFGERSLEKLGFKIEAFSTQLMPLALLGFYLNFL